MAYYPVNKRVYVADKKTGSIISFLIDKNSFTRPVVTLSGQNFGQVSGLAIDGFVYLLNGSNINKFLSGSPVAFTLPSFGTQLAAGGKIYTQNSYSNVYILDTGNKRILVLTKTGGLVETIESDQFTHPMDFSVDEPGKVIYVLNDDNLLKVILP